jgi:hypothetical protein
LDTEGFPFLYEKRRSFFSSYPVQKIVDCSFFLLSFFS